MTNLQEVKKDKNRTVVTFLTPVPYSRLKGDLVIVSLTQLREAQKEIESSIKQAVEAERARIMEIADTYASPDGWISTRSLKRLTDPKQEAKEEKGYKKLVKHLAHTGRRTIK
jgi:hypothetical protein